jgi:hypothetical protein
MTTNDKVEPTSGKWTVTDYKNLHFITDQKMYRHREVIQKMSMKPESNLLTAEYQR